MPDEWFMLVTGRDFSCDIISVLLLDAISMIYDLCFMGAGVNKSCVSGSVHPNPKKRCRSVVRMEWYV